MLQDKDGTNLLVATFVERVICIIVDRQTGEHAIVEGIQARTLADEARQGKPIRVSQNEINAVAAQPPRPQQIGV